MPSETTQYKKGDKKEIAYEFIRKAIMKNEFEPDFHLTEKALSGMLGNMSRTPIRDALMRLVHEGLVERIPDKGLFVTQVSISDLLEITETRLPLECTAVRLFVERADQAIRDQLHEILERHKRCLQNKEDAAAISCDNEFHYCIAKGSMNNRLYAFIRKLMEESFRGAFMTQRDRSRIEASIAQHERVVEAIDANDAELAARLVSDHLLDWIVYVKEMQFKNYYLFHR